MPTVSIPAWSSHGLLPPFDSLDPISVARSPYAVAMLDVVKRFGTSSERRVILRGWLDHRACLHRLGLVSGFQWFDGSFVENVEVIRGRPPSDVDVVSFVTPPPGFAPTSPDDEALDPVAAKAKYCVDAYFVELNLPPEQLVANTTYWYSLWAQTRGAHWKGFLQVDLAPFDEAAALAELDAADAVAVVPVGVASP